jgi:hypothetical protein
VRLAVPKDTDLVLFAAIRPDAGGAPACVARWVLGLNHDLPHDDDVFDVVLSLCDINGTKIEQIKAVPVKPRRLLMLDPPRADEKFKGPDGVEVAWRIATEPTRPVDPHDAKDRDLKNKPFGVVHLLSETETARIVWRAARVVALAMAKYRPAAKEFDVFDEATLHDIARRFALNVVRSGTRPRNLAAQLRTPIRALASLLSGEGLTNVAAHLFELGAGAPGQRAARAALVLNALADPATLAELDAVVKEPTQVREHLRVRALHGGELIDYWNDPDGSGPLPERGMRYPAAETVGLGCTISLTAAQIAQWVTGKNQVLVEVSQRPRPPAARSDQPLTSLDAGGVPGNVPAAEKGIFDKGSYPITWFMLRDAATSGRSIAIPPPSRAWVDYAMVSNDQAAAKPNVKDNGPGMTFATGDGRIELVIEPPPARSDGATTVAAYNVYGIWETAVPAASPLWDLAHVATLDELRSWRMSRRYWYGRDLQRPFPALAGVPNPRVVDFLNDPPWEPVLQRPTTLTSENSSTSKPLPNRDAGKGRYGIDLRRGMQAPPTPGLPPAWDLTLPVDTTWTPERDRVGRVFDPSLRRPERYRFWVTSVDAFEQESTPVPVETHDADAGEALAYLFEPRRRTPIPGPAAHDESIVLTHDTVHETLELRFQTPTETNVAGSTGASMPPSKMDKQKLVATIAFFRRRIVTTAQQSGEMPALALLVDAPQWRRTIQDLAGEGWRIFKPPMTVNPPPAGDTWSASAPVGAKDQGWEYRATVSFSAAPEFARYWASNAARPATPGRTLLRAVPDGKGGFTYEKSIVDETPRASDVFTTASVLIVNSARPRPAALDRAATKPLPAIPVPAPPSVRRDLVLLKLLTQSFARGTAPVKRAKWRDTLIELTEGQSAMCDAALRRTHRDDRPLDPGDPALAVSRSILARGFVEGQLAAPAVPGEVMPTPLRQHSTVGFRGVLDLRWTYQPLEIVPAKSGNPESEATQFRIYFVRAPRDAHDARRFATSGGTGRLVADATYQLALAKGATDGWETIATHAVPTLARVASAAGGDPVWATVSEAFTPLDGAWTVRLSAFPGSAALPDGAVVDLFAAQPVADVPVMSFDEIKQQSALLPIAGGHDEAMAWWIASVSAKGLEARGGSVPVWGREFPATIEPAAAQAVTVRGPWNNDTEVLDPAVFARWLPSTVRSAADAKYYPRLVLGWAADDASSEAYIAIERDERQVAKRQTALVMRTDVDPWKAIKSVEATPESEALQLDDLDAIRNSWLLGIPVEVTTPLDVPYFIVGTDDGERVKALDGLLKVRTDEVVADGTNRPGFIDYYGRNKDKVSAMDCNWEFRYRLRLYLDLDPGGALKLPPAWRFLWSMPTEWTPWCLPETPAIKLHHDNPTPDESDQHAAPSVRFTLKAGALLASQALMAKVADETQHRWEYRILIRRRLDVPMPSTGGTHDPVWVDVGKPLRLSESTGPRQIVDAEVDRAWSGDAPTLVYRIFVQQFLITEDAAGTKEHLIRGFDASRTSTSFKELPIVLPAPSSGKVEVELTQPLAIS